MGERYGTPGYEGTTTTGDTTMLALVGGTGVLFKIYDFMVGASGTPADNVCIYSLRRWTTSGGTGTAVTPVPLNALGALAAEVTATENHSAEPTYTGENAIELPVNQRASYRWVAAPGGEIISQLTATTGWGFTVRSPAYTGESRVTAHHEE